MKTLAERLKTSRTTAKLTQKQLAQIVGVDQSMITLLENGKRDGTASIAQIAVALGVDAVWLATGKGEMKPLQYPHYRVEEASDDPSLQIPYMNARGSCGGGSLNEQTWIKGYMSKEASWFAKFKVKNTDLVAIYADGDSMADFIVDGDMVIFDTSKTIPIDGHIFAIEHPSGTKIKKLRQNFDGSWVLVSNNPDKRKYPDEPISAEDAEHMIIRGQYVYRQG